MMPASCFRKTAERYLKPKTQMLALFEDLPEAVEHHKRDRRARRFLDGRAFISIFPITRCRPARRWIPSCGKSDRAVSTNVTRSRPWPIRSQVMSRARKRVSRDRDEKTGRLFPDRLRHLEISAKKKRYSFSRPRLGGKFGRLLHTRHHSGRADHQQASFRTISFRKVRAVSGHRHRPAVRRRPRRK